MEKEEGILFDKNSPISLDIEEVSKTVMKFTVTDKKLSYFSNLYFFVFIVSTIYSFNKILSNLNK